MSGSPVDRRQFLQIGVGLAAGLAACDDSAGDASNDAAAGGSAGDRDGGSDGGSDGATDGSPDAAAQDAAPDAGPDAAAPPPDATPQDDTLFPTAVVAGAMTAQTVLLRGQTAGPGARLRIWDEATGAVAHEADVSGDAGRLGLQVDGLRPDTTWRFAFFADGRRSPIGRFRTLPESGAPVVTLGATACTRDVNAPYKALSVMAGQPIDGLCHLGDMSYNDTAETLDEYRNRWRLTLQDPGYRDVFGVAGLYLTWDDHELGRSEDIPTFPPERIRAGVDAFFESLPVPRRDGDRFWASYRFGTTVELFVLDCRGERVPESRETPQAQYISPAQMDWLKRGLAESPCHFKAVMTSVPITAYPDTWGYQPDRWQGYAAQREHLLSHIIDRDVRNVWFLAGDFHFGAVCRVEAQGPRRRLWEILCGPGASRGNPLILLADQSPEQRESLLPVAQFPWYNGGHAATILRFDPAADAVRVTFLDSTDGRVLYDESLRESDA